MPPTVRTAKYQIHLQGSLEKRWLRWFEGLELDQPRPGETLIEGLLDQAALRGILNTVLDLGMEIITVRRIETETDRYCANEKEK